MNSTDRIQVTDDLAFAVDHCTNGNVIFWQIVTNPDVHTLTPAEAIALGTALISHANTHTHSQREVFCRN